MSATALSKDTQSALLFQGDFQGRVLPSVFLARFRLGKPLPGLFGRGDAETGRGKVEEFKDEYY
jgi:hypothetical protein